MPRRGQRCSRAFAGVVDKDKALSREQEMIQYTIYPGHDKGARNEKVSEAAVASIEEARRLGIVNPKVLTLDTFNLPTTMACIRKGVKIGEMLVVEQYSIVVEAMRSFDILSPWQIHHADVFRFLRDASGVSIVFAYLDLTAADIKPDQMLVLRDAVTRLGIRRLVITVSNRSYHGLAFAKRLDRLSCALRPLHLTSVEGERRTGERGGKGQQMYVADFRLAPCGRPRLQILRLGRDSQNVLKAKYYGFPRRGWVEPQPEELELYYEAQRSEAEELSP